MREVEGEVVPARDEPEPLVLRSSLDVADAVAAEVQSDPAEVGDREDWNLDVSEVVVLRAEVGLVEVLVLARVDRLLKRVGDQLLLREFTLDALGAKGSAEGSVWACKRADRQWRGRRAG